MSVIRDTYSLCPICLKQVKACLTTEGLNVYLKKSCDDHGYFSSVVWRGSPDISVWAGSQKELSEIGDCPDSCGICADHGQGTCCLLLEITDRCNLECPHCFAESTCKNDYQDPPLEQVKKWVAEIAATGKAFLQLSGGEPSLRDDLPEIIKYAKDKGCEYVQLNSNGLRLAEDEKFVASLADAGLSFVFMQFDGTNDTVYKKLRGRPLLDIKLKAIDLCGRHKIGVTLVPTIVPGVNDNDIGNIIKLAARLSPAVRGVHFQPVSYFGRFPQAPHDSLRITLPEVLQAVYKQGTPLVPKESLAASCCDHPRCGFHGAYIVMPDGSLKAYSKPKERPGPSTVVTADHNRHFVGLRWKRYAHDSCCQPKDLTTISETQVNTNDAINTLDGFLARARSHSFTISAMAFQDAYTLDLERLRQCSLHVFNNGNKIPFCIYYIHGGAKAKRFALK